MDQIKPLDFNNTEIAFKHLSNMALIRAFILFRIIKYTFLTRVVPPIVNFCFRVGLPINWLIKKTMFEHFCAGESISLSAENVDKLNQYGIEAILDFSVEGKERDEDFARTFQEVMLSINEASKKELGLAVFKLTGMARPTILEKVTQGISLSQLEQNEYELILRRIERLAKESQSSGVKLLIDAEETWMQDCIDQICEDFMEKYNKEKVVIYTTVQMYRTDRLDYMEKLLTKAKEKGFKIGVKIVRGAYMEKERERAEDHGCPSPIYSTKEGTDNAFDDCTRFCVKNIDHINILCGTHNEKSSKLLADLMAEKGIDKKDPRVIFSQLLGMSDHISYNLAHAGYNVSKYMPYGPIENVFPYLVRRAEENTSIQGQTGRELGLLKLEISRRKIFSGS